MKKIAFILSALLLVATWATAQQTNKDAILGEWLSENKDGKVLIYKQGEQYFGKVSWGKDGTKKDVHNPDEALRSQNIIGSVILKNFTFKGKAWEDGSVYDPQNGKTYSCIIKLKNTNELEIRGYVGISLLGRTTVWSRVK
ncbi:DUF2147 domain-containing protein [Flectobacillus major]|jgi:uncharacterized protein (DUF2147 family)|uniref:DUF2147 domain-containing protein n=1 Tax=Flectobacillus major TaxID=103 RepID=UPI0003FB3EA2|nr:DUF2147 domain-containing protein [Flectobacillus major]